MGYYYYLAAQLPYLVLGNEIPMSSAAFKTLARDTMSSSDAIMLDYCTLDPVPEAPASSDFIRRWNEWEMALRVNLARGRALKLKREDGVEPMDFPVEAVLAAKNALVMESPLEAELFLDGARWDAIESFQGTNVFSESAMYAYLLKLLLMERRAAFNAEEGFTEYKALYAAILG